MNSNLKKLKDIIEFGCFEDLIHELIRVNDLDEFTKAAFKKETDLISYAIYENKIPMAVALCEMGVSLNNPKNNDHPLIALISSTKNIQECPGVISAETDEIDTEGFDINDDKYGELDFQDGIPREVMHSDFYSIGSEYASYFDLQDYHTERSTNDNKYEIEYRKITGNRIPGRYVYLVDSDIEDFILGIMEVFNEHQCDFNVKDSEGSTVLHYACEEGLGQIIGYLLDRGVDPSIQNEFSQICSELLDSEFKLPNLKRRLTNLAKKTG